MKVIELKDNMFDRNVIINLLKHKTCFIGVFSDACVHCNNMKPEWNNLKKRLKKINSNTVLLEIDASKLDYIDFAELKNSIAGFPAIMIFKNGKMIKDYSGDRTNKDMFMFFKPFLAVSNKTIKKKSKRKRKTKQRKTRGSRRSSS